MRGRRSAAALFWPVIIGVLACGTMVASGQQVETSRRDGGITFNPPRRATIRHRTGRVLRGDLIKVTPDQVSFRVEKGNETQYPLTQIRSLVTADGEIQFTMSNSTYRELIEMVRDLKGVTVEDAKRTAAGSEPVEFPRPPAPQLAVMLDSPDKYRPRAIPAPPPHATVNIDPNLPNQPPPPPAVAATVSQPFHETSAFKIGFVVACLVVIAVWWRSRVG